MARGTNGNEGKRVVPVPRNALGILVHGHVLRVPKIRVDELDDGRSVSCLTCRALVDEAAVYHVGVGEECVHWTVGVCDWYHESSGVVHHAPKHRSKITERLDSVCRSL